MLFSDNRIVIILVECQYRDMPAGLTNNHHRPSKLATVSCLSNTGIWVTSQYKDVFSGEENMIINMKRSPARLYFIIGISILVRKKSLY